MAIFHLQITSVGRGTNRTATDAAAYRAGERIVDLRNGAVHDYSDRRDVVHREIVLPSQFTPEQVGWARDRQTLWNEVERAETRRNSRVAREYQMTLPSELDGARRQALTIAFSRDIAQRYGVAVDVAIHAPPATGDARNHHAHLLTTTREVTEFGFGRKVIPELREDARRALGLRNAREEFKDLRARWAELTNGALREAGLEARVDHRTLVAQGIDREPKHQPYHIYKAAQRALGAGPTERARELHRGRSAELTSANPSTPNVIDRASLQDVRRAAREAWAVYRAVNVNEGKPTNIAELKNPSKEPNAPAAEHAIVNRTDRAGELDRERSAELATASPAVPSYTERTSLEDVRRAARDAWSAYREANASEGKPDAVELKSPTKEPPNALATESAIEHRTESRKPDDDLAM